MTQKQQGFSALYALLILIVLLIVGFAGWYVWSRNDDSSENQETQAQEEMTIDYSAESERLSSEEEPSGVLDETEYYTLRVPEGFERTGERIFTFTGAPSETFTYTNATTGDYFEVNIGPAASGINADFTWTYQLTEEIYEGVYVLDKSDSTVCLPAEDEWCEFSGGNGRLDSAIFSAPGSAELFQRTYFTFGNITSETVGDLTYVDAFFADLVLKEI
jgi:hypothetical protein